MASIVFMRHALHSSDVRPPSTNPAMSPKTSHQTRWPCKSSPPIVVSIRAVSSSSFGTARFKTSPVSLSHAPTLAYVSIASATFSSSVPLLLVIMPRKTRTRDVSSKQSMTVGSSSLATIWSRSSASSSSVSGSPSSSSSFSWSPSAASSPSSASTRAFTTTPGSCELRRFSRRSVAAAAAAGSAALDEQQPMSACAGTALRDLAFARGRGRGASCLAETMIALLDPV
mmetsp:Transcript_23117/g.71462  ORF Transcript_23117/g.71462 Transcript_23117/m.71462 type:complete len:228 (+) Transcript_23117:583-1266(+)